jgi:outer membrane protein OmpA-like peptidoglycan-associated protein
VELSDHWHTQSHAAFRDTGPDHLGRWAVIALLVSLLLHVLAFFALDHMKIALKFHQAQEIRTGSVHVDRVEVRPIEPDEMISPDKAQPTPPAAPLMEEVDLLKNLPKNAEIDIKPDVLTPEYALRMEKPAQAGDPVGTSFQPVIGPEINADLPELGRADIALPPAATGQIVVDPGAVKADTFDPNRLAEQLIRKGAGGLAEKGALDGVTTLDAMLGLPANVLTNKTTLLPSDLLFEYNSSELRESARVGLMKLALLIERNPGLYCWIEGNTDLFGGDAFNLDLSRRRADAVKNYLVRGLRLDGSKIITRGYGKMKPLVATGSVEQQSLNRRVEIKMRKTQPTEADAPHPPVARAAVVNEEPPPPRAVLVKPSRVPTAEDIQAPRATAVPEKPATPQRAIPVEEAPPPAATPVEENPPSSPPRALPIGD